MRAGWRQRTGCMQIQDRMYDKQFLCMRQQFERHNAIERPDKNRRTPQTLDTASLPAKTTNAM